MISRHHSGWVAPFGISGFIACMQLPLNVSPVSASFIGRQRQGIHLVLCLACSFLCLLCLHVHTFIWVIIATTSTRDKAHLRFGTIEERFMFSCSSADVGLPTPQEWKTRLAC